MLRYQASNHVPRWFLQSALSLSPLRFLNPTRVALPFGINQRQVAQVDWASALGNTAALRRLGLDVWRGLPC